MKKNKFLTIVFVLIILISNAQQVQRERVVVEIGTGTWCQYCPGAAMGADDLVSNGKLVAIVENHNGDTYANTYSNARNTFYGISSFPTAKFDGIQTVVGGSHSSSMYSSYLPKYNNRIAILSDFTIEKAIYPVSGNDYIAHIVLNKVGSPTATNMKLLICITQSHIVQNWQGQTHLNYVNRLMAPNATGTVVDFTSGNTQTYNIPFTLNASWPLADLEFVAFIQNSTTKEILQGTVAPFSSIVGVQENVKNNDFNLHIYPNPFSETAMIAFDLKESSTAVINIYDIVGKNVYSNNLGTVDQGVVTVDFDGSKMEAGMYIVKLTINEQTITRKITLNK